MGALKLPKLVLIRYLCYSSLIKGQDWWKMCPSWIHARTHQELDCELVYVLSLHSKFESIWASITSLTSQIAHLGEMCVSPVKLCIWVLKKCQNWVLIGGYLCSTSYTLHHASFNMHLGGDLCNTRFSWIWSQVHIWANTALI